MDTVSNLASAARKAIWGEQTKTQDNETTGQEPVSGQTGNVEDGEPYDKGNADPSSHTNTDRTHDFEESRNTPTAKPATDLLGNASANTAGAAPTRPEDSKTDVPTSSGDTAGPDAAPSVGADPSSAQQSTQKQQGADRPGEEPGSGEHDRIKEAKKDAEDAQKVDASGPGPVPLEQRAKEGGAAGAGASGGDDDRPQKESHGEGTREKYVKSTGVKAEGGDFDATKPGAGKEADRLLEQKGFHREAPGSRSKDDSTTGDNGGTEGKHSLKEKIKEKLHRN